METQRYLETELPLKYSTHSTSKLDIYNQAKEFRSQQLSKSVKGFMSYNLDIQNKLGLLLHIYIDVLFDLYVLNILKLYELCTNELFTIYI